MDLIAWSTRYSRSVVLIPCFIPTAGVLACVSIPGEAEPDVWIPVLYVVRSQSGVSPEDAERLPVKPAEQALSSVESVKETMPASTKTRQRTNSPVQKTSPATMILQVPTPQATPFRARGLRYPSREDTSWT